jgi:hypothetical protein
VRPPRKRKPLPLSESSPAGPKLRRRNRERGSTRGRKAEGRDPKGEGKRGTPAIAQPNGACWSLLQREPGYRTKQQCFTVPKGADRGSNASAGTWDWQERQRFGWNRGIHEAETLRQESEQGPAWGNAQADPQQETRRGQTRRIISEREPIEVRFDGSSRTARRRKPRPSGRGGRTEHRRWIRIGPWGLESQRVDSRVPGEVPGPESTSCNVTVLARGPSVGGTLRRRIGPWAGQHRFERRGTKATTAATDKLHGGGSCFFPPLSPFPFPL